MGSLYDTFLVCDAESRQTALLSAWAGNFVNQYAPAAGTESSDANAKKECELAGDSR